MAKTTIVPVKLTETELEVVNELVRHFNFDSRSAVIRAGLGLLMEKMKVKRSTEIFIEGERKKSPPRQNKKLKPWYNHDLAARSDRPHFGNTK